MSIEFDGISFPSAEARAYYINSSKAERAKWREAHHEAETNQITTAPAETPPINAPPIEAQQSASAAEVSSAPPISALPPRDREEVLSNMQGADLSALTDEELEQSTKLLEAFCTRGNEERKAEARRRRSEMSRRESAARIASNGRAHELWQTPKLPAAARDSKLANLLSRAMPIRDRCDTARRRGQTTGAWAYLRDKGLDPGVTPPSVMCVPYLHPPFGAVVGLSTDHAGNVLAAQAIMIDREGKLAERFGDGSGKINKVGDKSWYTQSAVRMPGPPEAPLVLAEGITTAVALWQATGFECWAVLGAKRFSKVPLPNARDLIVALDSDEPDSPGAKDTAKSLDELRHARSFKIARPGGDRGYDFCDLLRDRGVEAVRAAISAAELIEHQPQRGKKSKKAVRPPAEALRSEADDGRVLIEDDDIHLTESLDLVERAMRDQQAPVFQRGSRLARIHRLDHQEVKEDIEVVREPGALVIRDYSPAQFRERVYSHVQFWEPSWVDGVFIQAPVPVPKWVVEHLLDRDERWSWNPLSGIVEAPTMRVDGTILDQPGYDPSSGLYYDSGKVAFDPIPPEPTKADAVRALEKLTSVVEGFPFDGNENGRVKCPSRSAALSLLLSPFVARVAKPPAHLADANAPRSGKSLLIDSASLIATGKRAAHMDWDLNDQENVKRLSGVLLQGDLMLSIDNVERPLGGSFLCSILTQETVQVRILGQTGQPHVRTNLLIAASGNNIKVKGDLSVRSIKFRLDARRERPGERKFEVDLYKYIPAHRHELVPACLTVLRAWALAPEAERSAVLKAMTPMGGFEAWSERVRAALVWLDECDPCATVDEVIEQEEGEAKYAAMVAGWIEALPARKKVGSQDGCDLFGTDGEANDAIWCSLDKVVQAAERTPSLKAALTEITPREVKSPAHALGTFLKPFVDRAIGITDSDGQRRAYRVRKRQHPRLRTMQYLVEEIEA